jgi:hypothetical protein
MYEGVCHLEETEDCWGPFDEVPKGIINKIKLLKYHKDPCKKCIVRACCGQRCEAFRNHLNYITMKKYIFDNFGLGGIIFDLSMIIITLVSLFMAITH